MKSNSKRKSDNPSNGHHISRYKYPLLVTALFVTLVLNLFQYSRKDNMDASQLRDVAYSHMIKDCLKVAKTEIHGLDCTRLEVLEPELEYVNIGGRDKWLIQGVVKMDNKELDTVSWDMRLDSRGEIVQGINRGTSEYLGP